VSVTEPLHGERVVLRPLGEADSGWILEMLREPDVERWWGGPYDLERVERELLGGDDEQWLAIESGGEAVGIVGWWEETDPQYRHAGIDISLRSGWHGRRLGRDAVRTLACWLLDVRGHHRVTIDPAAHNERAIRCYESVGFRRVGVMRRYERLPGGELRDGLLMDLLSEDLKER
jgi:aminoglycoside 6'-N-acetyltransferase